MIVRKLLFIPNQLTLHYLNGIEKILKTIYWFLLHGKEQFLTNGMKMVTIYLMAQFLK